MAMEIGCLVFWWWFRSAIKSKHGPNFKNMVISFLKLTIMSEEGHSYLKIASTISPALIFQSSRVGHTMETGQSIGGG